MSILLGFLPFLAFALLGGVLGATGGLLFGAAISAALIVRGRRNGAAPKILEIGTFVLFLAVALYVAIAGRTVSIIGVRLCVDSGLLAIVLISMAARRPFTLEYAREQVAREYWNSPHFVRTNYVITMGWALAFLVMVVAEAALLYVPALPPAIGVIAIVAALLGAVGFTNWYAKLSRAAVRPVPDPLPQ